jgi:hypothetical protein
MPEAVTPETAAVDAPVSMDSIVEEIATGTSAADPVEDVVAQLVEEQREGEAEPAAEPEEDATEAVESDEETAEEEPEDQEDAPEPTYKVKVNGEEVEVPLSELTKGYSREQDYTKKTMALAEKERTLQSQFASELKQATDLFESLDPILSEARNIDWQALAANDPATYVQLREAVTQRQAAVDAARAKIAQASHGDAQAEAAQIAETAQRETEALVAKAKDLGLDLSTPEALNGFATEAVSYLRGNGFEDAEIADLVDHRALTIVDKARRYDALEKAKAELPAKKIRPETQGESPQVGQLGFLATRKVHRLATPLAIRSWISSLTS